MSLDKLYIAKKEYEDYLIESRKYNDEAARMGDGRESLRPVLKSLVFKVLALQSLTEGIYDYLLDKEVIKQEVVKELDKIENKLEDNKPNG